MNISGISGQSSQGGVQSQSNSVLDALQRQKENLQNQIQRVRESKLDSKTKEEKIKELTVQMEQIDQQIMQEKQAEKEQATEKTAQKSAENSLEKKQEEAEKNGDSPAVLLSSSLNAITSVGSRMKEYSTLDKVRNHLVGEMNVASAEIKNSVGGASLEGQMKTISTDSGQLGGVMFRMGKTSGTIQQQMRHAAKEGEIEARHSGTGVKTGEKAEKAVGSEESEGDGQERKANELEKGQSDKTVNSVQYQPVDLLA